MNGEHCECFLATTTTGCEYVTALVPGGVGVSRQGG
jgi:hypothetical protein